MEIRKTLQPGEPGTKQLLAQYGEQLVCVRYRIDRQARKRWTTVELVIEEKPYYSATPAVNVQVRIAYGETELRQQVKAAGARWQAAEKLWEMDYETARRLGLKKRIVRRLS